MSEGASGAEWIELFANIAQILGILLAIVALVLATKALTTWRKELRAAAEHEAALDCLIAVRQMRQAIASYRNPFRQMSEIVLNFSQGAMERHVLKGRYEEFLKPAERDLRKCEIRASVLWEEEIREPMKNLTDCLSDLAHYSREYLNRADEEWQAEEQTHTYRQAERVVKIPPVTEGVDEFGGEVNNAIEVLEGFLGPKLATQYRQR